MMLSAVPKVKFAGRSTIVELVAKQPKQQHTAGTVVEHTADNTRVMHRSQLDHLEMLLLTPHCWVLTQARALTRFHHLDH